MRFRQRRSPDHPDFDPRTLYIPPDFMKKQTPGHRVWWEFKAKYMDMVLFFKVGKFYETYHMDADVLVKELDLMYVSCQSLPFSLVPLHFTHALNPPHTFSCPAT